MAENPVAPQSREEKPAVRFECPRRGKILRTELNGYFVFGRLGTGTFCTVICCRRYALLQERNEQTDMVAMKFLDRDRVSLGMAEAEILRILQANNGHLYHCVVMLEVIENFRGHYCIVFEELDRSLRQFLEDEGYQSLNDAKTILKDVLKGLQFLKRIGIIHTDLKPANIAFINLADRRYRVKIIDFGCALDRSRYRMRETFELQTPNYRSPEIILKYQPYDQAIDMWSLGVIMLECVTYWMLPYRMLYDTLCEYDLMRHIVEAQGMPPKFMLDGGRDTTVYFNKTKAGKGWRLKTPREYMQGRDYQAKRLQPFQVDTDRPELMDGFGSTVMHCFNSTDLAYTNRSAERILEQEKAEIQRRSDFGDLINRMLDVNLVTRIHPTEALRHPLFTAN